MVMVYSVDSRPMYTACFTCSPSRALNKRSTSQNVHSRQPMVNEVGAGMGAGRGIMEYLKKFYFCHCFVRLLINKKERL